MRRVKMIDREMVIHRGVLVCSVRFLAGGDVLPAKEVLQAAALRMGRVFLRTVTGPGY